MSYVVIFLSGVLLTAILMGVLVLLWREKVKSASELSQKAMKELEAVRESQRKLAQDTKELRDQREALAKRVITYEELSAENLVLKRDLQNIDVNLNKLQLDVDAQDQRQGSLEQRSNQLAQRYLSESVKAIVAAVGPNNFSVSKQRLLSTIQRCREIGYEISKDNEAKLLADLKTEFEKAVKAEFERQEQARIKAQIREEERLKRDAEREIKQAEREQAAIQAALDQALAAANNQHTAEVQRLQEKLAEAEERAKRAISMAQLTKSGHVYVISNIGSFGSDVFKVGMTRRLDPKERVYELGCAAVPFPFDIHMMIRSEDAPALENALHRALHKQRINKANPRKEFFKTNVEIILQAARTAGATVEYVADAEALEYHQSLNMSDEDAELIDRVYEMAHDDDAVVEGDLCD